MNESSRGRDGYILARGRRIYHVYKQSFPMEFWYGLTSDANRECSDGLQIDVRTLPKKYRYKGIEVDWTSIPRRSMARAMRDQLNAHAVSFASALFDGYSLEGHARSEREREEREWQAAKAAREADQALRREAGLCVHCGEFPAATDGECEICAEIPF